MAEVHPGAPRPTPDNHPGAPRPVPDVQNKPPELPLGPPPSLPGPMRPQMVSPVQPLAPSSIRPPIQAQLPPPMVPTLPPPMVPTAAAAPLQPPTSTGTAMPTQPGLASPKPPPRSRSSHALPPQASSASSTATESQTNGINGIQSEAQLKMDPFAPLTSDLFSSTSWLNTQSLSRSSSLHSSFHSSTSSRSLNSTPVPPFPQPNPVVTPDPMQALLAPPPPSRSRSQETLSVSSNPFLSDVQSRTNPFTGTMTSPQRRSLTPDFDAKPGLQCVSSSFNHRSTLPSSFSKAPSALTQPLPNVQQWVTFDDDSDLQMPGKASASTAMIKPPLLPLSISTTFQQPQSSFSSSGFDSNSNWASLTMPTLPTLPPPMPDRTNPSSTPGNPLIPEFTER